MSSNTHCSFTVKLITECLRVSKKIPLKEPHTEPVNYTFNFIRSNLCVLIRRKTIDISDIGKSFLYEVE